MHWDVKLYSLNTFYIRAMSRSGISTPFNSKYTVINASHTNYGGVKAIAK